MLQIKNLSEKQQEILGFIRKYDAINGHMPTLDEIASNFRKSVPTIHEHVKALRMKGYLKSPTSEARNLVPYESVEDTTQISLLGKVSAGGGIENLEEKQPITVQKSLLSSFGEHYALQVVGISMIEDGILPEDFVIARYQNYADNGDVVIALIEEDGAQKATIKRFYHHGNRIELRPRNPGLPSRWYNPGEIEIRGKFISLVRKG